MFCSRRAALALFPLTAAGLLSGCGIFSSTTSGGVTKITVNTARLAAYAAAIDNGVNTLLSIPALTGALGSIQAAAVRALGAAIVAAANQLASQGGGSQSITFDATSIPSALVSLHADANTIFGDFSAVMKSIGNSVAVDVITTFNALQTIVSLVVALTAGTAVASATLASPIGPKAMMTEKEALTVLHVH